MAETVYFIFFTMGYGAMGLGQITKSEFDNWRERGFKPKVMYPKRFNLIPMTDKANPQKIIGYNVTVTPMQMHKTKQKELCMDLAEVEILGEVEDQKGTLVCTGEGQELFNELYIDAVKQWEIEMSGLAQPSPEETAAVLNKGTIPFPRNRRK